MSAVRVSVSDSLDSPVDTTPDQPQIRFTRQLWERTMPMNAADKATTTRGRFVSLGDDIRSEGPSGSAPTSFSHSSYSQQHPQSPARSLSTASPATPEDPQTGSGKKRRASSIDHDGPDTSPSHSRESSDGAFQPCLCQPEPKIPRPRNAFILYRQHHNAGVVAQNPGLANPGISKVIGELWRNESAEEKERWKTFAKAEKTQHEAKYPDYRYQPKRAVRRGSTSSDNTPYPWSELRKCPKCGGRSVIQPSTPSSIHTKQKSVETSPTSDFPPPRRANTVQLPPPTPSSTTTPSTRYLPMLNNLSLSSPQSRRIAPGPGQQYVYPPIPREEEDRFPPTPDAKRRRFDRPQGGFATVPRAVPQRPGTGPGTPFPFPPQHPMTPSRAYPQVVPSNSRRVSLPHATELIRAPTHGQMGFPAAMSPPPRPGMGYSQHRMSQGRQGQDHNLTLPPLQTVNVPARMDYPSADSAGPSSGLATGIPDTRTIAEIIMDIPFEQKINILSRVAHPPTIIPGDGLRGAVVAIEGDDPEVAKELCDWLGDFLGKDKEVDIAVLDGPRLPHSQDGMQTKVEDLFDMARDWHAKTKDILGLIAPKSHDTNQPDSDARAQGSPRPQRDASAAARKDSTSDKSASSGSGDAMDVDTPVTGHTHPKTILLLRTYTLTASNVFAASVEIQDTYRPFDHWQWTATMWRNVVGPDITIYVKDVHAKDGVESQVEMREDVAAMVVKRVRGVEGAGRGGVGGIDAGALRRLGFEVGEWARGFGTSRRMSRR